MVKDEDQCRLPLRKSGDDSRRPQRSIDRKPHGDTIGGDLQQGVFVAGRGTGDDGEVVLQAQRRQVEFAITHGWAPEIATTDRMGKAEQGVLYSVFKANHALQNGFEGRD